jgi:hypothetical protein
MRAILTAGVAVAALLGATTAQAASVEFKDAVARVVVIPENRTDVKVEFLTTSPGLPLTVHVEGDKTIVDGDLGRGAIHNCRTINGETTVWARGKTFGWDAIPQVVVRVPMAASVAGGGAVFGSIGRTDSLTLSNAGCGDWTVGNVAGELKINLAGSGDTTVGTAGSTAINIAGSGDVKTAAVGALTVNIAGSGDVEAAEVNGAFSANIMGSGDVKVRGGAVGPAAVSIAGSGDVTILATAQSLDARVAGSGDVRVVSVSGPVTKKVAGSGDVTIGPVEDDAD